MFFRRLAVLAAALSSIHCGLGGLPVGADGDLSGEPSVGHTSTAPAASTPSREPAPSTEHDASSTPGTGEEDAGVVTSTSDDGPRPTFACGQPGGAHTTVGGHDVWDVRGRGYRYFVPNGYDPSRRYSVVVALHGYGSPGGGLSFSDWFGLHEHVEDAAIVVYPSAAGDWNVGSPWDDFTYLDEVLANLGGKMCFDKSRTFGLGFSLGGWFAQRWACRRPDVLRAVAVAASGWPGEEDPSTCAKVTTLVYGRTLDPTVSIETTRAAREQNRASLSCWGGAEAAPWMLQNDQGVTGCSSYSACGSGKKLVFCEDPNNLSQGDNSWNHTFASAYQQPVWRWLESQ